MRCNVDSDMGNDTSIIGCDAIKIQSVQLDLVNTQDLAADAWVAPKQNDQMVIPRGILPPAAYTNLVKQRTAAARVKSAALNPINLNQVNLRTCSRGLVNLGGECLPPLRR